MENQVWKWVLNQQDESELKHLINQLKVKIPGFRKGSIPKNLKPLVINYLLKPATLTRLSRRKIELHKEMQDKYKFHVMSVEELKNIQDVSPSLILYKLLTEDEGERASSLFVDLLENYGEEGLRELQQERETKMKEIYFKEDNNENEIILEPAKEKLDESKVIQDRKTEKISKKLDEKIKSLQFELEKVQSEFKEYREKQKNEQSEKNKQIQKLKEESGLMTKNIEHINSKYREEKIIWELEKNNLILELKKVKEENKSLRDNFLDRRDNFTTKVGLTEKKKIYVVGNPRNNRILENAPYELVVVERNEVTEVDWSECDEIWVLMYKIDHRVIADLSSLVKRKLKFFETFQDFKQEIEKGREIYEEQKVGS
ncbi:hypothetical protein [Metabacillus fastidiosus]|uniref:hypothetical protein n=1 Tax=Metabacillus fastidiosus TaxID=1458 RepID=UPI002E1F8804|nr:hypothetical protein [Metabacillus fastidiosus]